MLKIECSCGNRAYLEYLAGENNNIALTLDTDTMGLEYDSEKGLEFKCPQCGKKYSIIRVE